MPDKLTPEEYDQLAKSPADSGVVFDEDGEGAPEGVVEDEASARDE
jgi:hypothetical protein